MALIKCPECGKEISNRAVSCPYCGLPLDEDTIEQVKKEKEEKEKEEKEKEEKEEKEVPYYLEDDRVAQNIKYENDKIVVDGVPLRRKEKGENFARLDNPFWVATLIAIILIIAFGFIGLIGSAESDEQSDIQKYKTTQTSTPKPTSTSNPTGANQDTFNTDDYTVLNYDDVARNPSDYKGTKAVITGSVVQVSETTLFGTTSVTLRVATNGASDDIWYVTYTRSSDDSRILEGDEVTIYGVCEGVETYVAILGSQVTIPKLEAKKVVLGKVVNGEAVVFDAEEIAGSIVYNEYRYSSYFYKDYILEVTNPSAYDIDLTANIKFYDASDSLIGVNSMSSSIESNGTTLISCTYDEDFQYAKVEFEIQKCSYTTPIQSELSTDVIQKSDKLIVTVTNNSAETASMVQAKVLFFSGDTVVDYSLSYVGDSDYEIKPGKDCSKEIDFSSYDGKSFDSYKIYVSGSVY